MKKLLRTIALAAVVAAPAVYASAEITGTGTEADPYLIGSAEDLGNAYTKTAWTESVVYFLQTADIDMTGVTEYKPVNGGNGKYNTAFCYDGGNHVIKNFAPASEKAVAEQSNYYNTSIFGVLTGTVKNLGVVDANINITDPGAFGTGVLAGYAGHGNAAALAPTTTIENVYVTGKVVAKGDGCGYSGGLFGTTGSDIVVKNSYANVALEANNNTAGICGRLRNALTLENVYAAGTIDCAGAKGLIVSSDKTDKAVKVTNVVAFNSGATEAANSVVLTGEIKVATADTKAALIAEVQGWEAFSATALDGEYPALAWAATAPAEPDGTEANPYIIATAEDLCNAYAKTAWTDHVVYFLQTADIDMAGVTAYKPVNGGNANYTTAICYDGGNHVIKNFAPASEKPDAAQSNYYNTSIFGVLTGTVKNLGVVDVNIDITDAGAFGTGVLAGYAGHGNAAALAPTTTIENVYVSGKLVAKGDGCGYSGGLIGTTGSDVTIKNSYANVALEANNNTAGICGRLRNALTLENVYAAGTIDCAGAKGLIVSSDKTDKAVTATNVVAFNSGADAAANSVVLTGEIKVATADTKAALIAEVQGWEAFSNTLYYEGYPALSWQTDATTEGPVTAVDNIAADANAPVEYFNLQGVRVANPENGVYLRRQGNKVSKVLVK